MPDEYGALHLELGTLATRYVTEMAAADHPVTRIATSMFYCERDETVPIAKLLVRQLLAEPTDSLRLELGKLVTAYLVRSMGEGYPFAMLTTGMFIAGGPATVTEAQELLNRIFGEEGTVKDRAPALKRYLGLED